MQQALEVDSSTNKSLADNDIVGDATAVLATPSCSPYATRTRSRPTMRRSPGRRLCTPTNSIGWTYEVADAEDLSP